MFKEIKPNQIEKNPFDLISKEWMLITVGDEKKANTMTASWGALGHIWNKDVAYIGIRPERYTKTFVDENACLSLCFFGDDYRSELAFCGRVSGRDTDKIKSCNFTLDYLDGVPYIKESKMVLICKKLYKQALEPDLFFDADIVSKCYPTNDLHDIYTLEIQKVLVKS